MTKDFACGQSDSVELRPVPALAPARAPASNSLVAHNDRLLALKYLSLVAAGPKHL